jgi:hypothetical protein
MGLRSELHKLAGRLNVTLFKFEQRLEFRYLLLCEAVSSMNFLAFAQASSSVVPVIASVFPSFSRSSGLTLMSHLLADTGGSSQLAIKPL